MIFFRLIFTRAWMIELFSIMNDLRLTLDMFQPSWLKTMRMIFCIFDYDLHDIFSSTQCENSILLKRYFVKSPLCKMYSFEAHSPS